MIWVLTAQVERLRENSLPGQVSGIGETGVGLIVKAS